MVIPINTIDQSECRRLDLGTLRRNMLSSSKDGAYGWTVSLSDKMRILRKDIRPSPPSLRTRFLKWGVLTIDQQINFFISYIDTLKKCLLFPACTGLDGSFELTKAGNVHLHLIVYSSTPKLDVLILRRLVAQHKICQVLHMGKNMVKLNFIHELESVTEWIDYLLKDYVVFGRVMRS